MHTFNMLSMCACECICVFVHVCLCVLDESQAIGATEGLCGDQCWKEPKC